MTDSSNERAVPDEGAASPRLDVVERAKALASEWRFEDAGELVPELVAEVERLRGEIPADLDIDLVWVDHEGGLWQWDDYHWWHCPQGREPSDSFVDTPLVKDGPFQVHR